MKKIAILPFFLFLAATVSAQFLWEEPAVNKDMKPEQTEYYEPVPPEVTPGNTDSEAPSDAIVLFDGSNLDQWVDESTGGKPNWTVENGIATVTPRKGGIKTKENFGDCQLHIEWRTPNPPRGEGQDRANSGVFFQGEYELQVLDSYHADTYVNGQAGSIYKDRPPLVNATKAPGEWQSYDVIYHAPVFEENGRLVKPATMTVLHNGVLIQDHVKLQGKTLYTGVHYYKKHGEGPISLQDHSHPVSYRNIWIRPL